MNLVLDSSVIAKWYLSEKQTQESLKLRALHIENLFTITAPKLLFFELGNIFVSHKLNQQDFNGNFDKLINFEIEFVETDLSLLASIFALASQYKLSFYDSTYVALAQSLKCDFITADKKLFRATRKLKFVKLL